MQKNLYYAAHNEGQFFTARQALAATGAPVDQIEKALDDAKRDAVLLDFGTYSALTTPSADGSLSWTLWRAFTREASTSRDDVQAFIEQFPPDLRGGWAIFEYVPDAPPLH